MEVPEEDNLKLPEEDNLKLPEEDNLKLPEEVSHEEPELLLAKEESDEDTDLLRLPIWHAGFNFTNIVQAAFN